MPNQALYQALDAITGGLSAFMAVGTDETWRQEGYSPFSLTTMSPDGMLFGLHTEINGDLCPDPIYNVKVDHQAKTATVRLVDTLQGYYRVAEDEDQNDAAEATGLLAEVLRRRRQAGEVEIKRVRY